MSKIAVLIPCLNEEKTIAKVIKDVKNQLPEADIYVYDNGSIDNTKEQSLKAGAIVKQELNRGKGNVVKAMFRDVDADCYVMLDGDDTYDTEKLKQMVSLVLQNNTDMVIGNRMNSVYFKENKKLFNCIGNKFLVKLTEMLFKRTIKDVLTGCRTFNNEFVKNFPAESKKFEIETELTVYALANNKSIDFVDIDYRDRPEGSYSKINILKDGLHIMATLVKLIFKYR